CGRGAGTVHCRPGRCGGPGVKQRNRFLTDTAADRHGQDKRWRAFAERVLGAGSRTQPDGTANSSRWIVCQRIDDPDVERARAQIADDLAHGATGLALVFDGAPNAFGYGLPGTAEALEQVL